MASAREAASSRIPRWLLYSVLGATLIGALGLRVYHLERAPAGLDVDECANAWNAWCLLQTGRDQHGQAWPITDSAGFGQGTTTLYLYVLMPFYRVLGLTTTSTRLPAAIGGALTVALLYYIGSRMFDASVGLVAAILLSISPWHLQQSRWGHMATMFPLAVAALVASIVWAGFPLTSSSRPRTLRAAVAGFTTALFFYGYYAIRLWVPLFLLVLLAFIWPEFRRLMKSDRGRIAIASYIATAVATAAPLVVGILHDPLLRRRATVTWVWNPNDPFITRVGNVLSRYPEHFGLDFLFRRGDPYPAMAPPPGYGFFLWFTLPLMIVGAAWIVAHRREVEARALAAWVIAYPFADLLSAHEGAHGLRSLPGVLALTLLSAIGAVALVRYFSRATRTLAISMAVAIAIAGATESIAFTRAYFQNLDEVPVKFISFAADLVDVGRWMKPRFDRYDAIFVTGNAISNPYIYTLVTLQYSPQRWFADEKTFQEGPLPNGRFRYEQICLRYGKLHFIFPGASDGALERLSGNGKAHRVLLVLRPGELSTMSLPPPIYRVRDSTGREALWVIETKL